MGTEITVSINDVLEAIAVIKYERNLRVKHGDAGIESLNNIIQALEEADRIVIQ